MNRRSRIDPAVIAYLLILLLPFLGGIIAPICPE